MSFFKNLFSKDEPFVPTPSQTVPGLEPIVVQAIENLYPNIEDQKRVFEYSLKFKEVKKDWQTRYLLALLAYSKGKTENLVDLAPNGPLSSIHFLHDDLEPIFPNMKAAEKWVKSISKPQV
jgi:hypothetical protein